MAERGLGRSIRVVTLGALASCTAGCVGLQTSGPVTPVTQADLGSSNVRTVPSPPFPGEEPSAIVSAFLQSAGSGPENADITNAYLTGSALDEWQQDQDNVLVLADTSQSPVTPVGPVSDTATYATETFGGDLVGTLDDNQQYQAQAVAMQYTFELTKTKQGFRISHLPENFGVVVQQADFESEYVLQDIYFGNAALNNSKLIPTQVYLPASDPDLATANELTDLELLGVPSRLGKAASSGVGQAARKGSVQFQADDMIQVTLAGTPCSKAHADCDLFAMQLAATFSNSLSSTKVNMVRVVDAGDSASGQASAPSSTYDYGVGGRAKAPNVFMVTADGQVERLSLNPNSTGGTDEPKAISIGSGKTKFGHVAVQPGQPLPNFALTSQDGKNLYLVNQVPYAGELHAVFTGNDISSLSWDESGHLWFTAVSNGVTQVYRYSDGNYYQVQLEGLAGQVKSVAAAPDSDRVAIAYSAVGSSTPAESIVIGAAAVQPDGSGTLDLTDAETVVDSWSSISDFGWYNEDSLSVLGTPATAASLRLYRLYADGSPVYDALTQQQVEPSPVTDTTDMCWNADGQPIVSTKEGKLYALSVEGQDAQPLTDGPVSSPSY